MIIRSKLLPQNLRDFVVTAFLLILIPVVYWFELFVVLPTYYELWSSWYTLHFIAGTYILFNVSGNLVAIILCDTSIKGRVWLTTLKPNWRLCPVCETYAPPRSWHCSACNICILKRDHHCVFTGCCIGHFNYRYFYTFVLYIFIATLYASYYNVFYAWSLIDFSTYMSYVKVVFPLAMICLEKSFDQLALFLCLIVGIGCIFSGVLLYFHTYLMLQGIVTHERNNMLNEYDLGARGNVCDALGEHWYLVWLFPLVKSKLPHDGIHWETKISTKGK